MRTFLRSACLIALATTACHAGSPVATAKRTLAKPTAAAATSAPKVTSTLLKKPTGDVREVAGVVQLEANYALAHGASLISDNGGGVLRLAEAALIANNGGNLISDNGGALISDNGGAIVANNGGGIIANNSGGLTGKTKFGLLSAPEVPIGTLLPAAGMAVGVQDLGTGKLLPIGQGANGQAATAIVTDAGGHFKVYVPASATGSLRVVGMPLSVNDARLRSALLTSQLGSDVTLDEDTAQIANFLRQCLITQFFRAFDVKGTDVDAASDFLALADPQTADDLRVSMKGMQADYVKFGLPQFTQERKLRIAERLTDVVLSHAQLEQIALPSTFPPGLTALFKSAVPPAAEGEPATALPAIGNMFASIRAGVGKKMQALAAAGQDPTAFFSAKDYVLDANQRDNTTYTIIKPADFNDFLNRGVANDLNLDGTASTLLLIQIIADKDLGLDSNAASTFARAELAVSLELTRVAYSGDQKALPELHAALAEEVQATAP